MRIDCFNAFQFLFTPYRVQLPKRGLFCQWSHFFPLLGIMHTVMSPLIIVGCTASGKSDLAEFLAENWLGPTGRPAVIMAVDSMQVYRGMDIGTAKPSIQTRQRISHEMIDVADPWEAFSAARFAAMANPILDACRASQTPLILVAGTILYLRALLEGLFEGPPANAEIRGQLAAFAAEHSLAALHQELSGIDPVSAARIHINDQRRIIRALEVFRLTGQTISDLQTQWRHQHPQISARIIGISRDKSDLNSRINRRVRAMIDLGLVDEVSRLAAAPGGLSDQARQAVGYREILDYIAGRMQLPDALERIKINTRHLAKLQRTWLKRFPTVEWMPADAARSIPEIAQPILEQLRSSVLPPTI